MHSKPPDYTTHETGRPFTISYRIHLLHHNHSNDTKIPISPFHDIPLHHTPSILNMIVEIPRFTNAKLEVSKPPFSPLHSH